MKPNDQAGAKLANDMLLEQLKRMPIEQHRELSYRKGFNDGYKAACDQFDRSGVGVGTTGFLAIQETSFRLFKSAYVGDKTSAALSMEGVIRGAHYSGFYDGYTVAVHDFRLAPDVMPKKEAIPILMEGAYRRWLEQQFQK